VHGGAQFEDFAAGEVGVKDGFVGKEADEALDLDTVFEGIEGIDEDFSVGSFEDAHEQAEESGFAGAVGAEQAADLAWRDGEGDVAYREFRAEGFCNIFDSHQIGGRARRIAGYRLGLFVYIGWRSIAHHGARNGLFSSD
jgi:hypothetical protein